MAGVCGGQEPTSGAVVVAREPALLWHATGKSLGVLLYTVHNLEEEGRGVGRG